MPSNELVFFVHWLLQNIGWNCKEQECIRMPTAALDQAPAGRHR